MRYENWDVLLFPEGSKVPIQEFKTQCFVTKDTESPYLQNPSIINPAPYAAQGNFGQIPVLTSFIPTQATDSAFRISIHSWEKPRPSRLTESMMQSGDLLLFEVRVFIDRECVGGGILSQRTSWPYVIETSHFLDRDGNPARLIFPSFHREILEQSHWDAGDTNGRIRVIIAEGFARPLRSPPFERVKDVIILSFQHAPLNILEYSNIAWPNPGMWSLAASKYNSIPDSKDLDNAHGHSPTKSLTTNHAWATNRAFPVPVSQLYQVPQVWQQAYADRWSGPPVNDVPWRHRGARSSREDIPMPDYTSSSACSSRALSGNSGMSGLSYEASVDDEQYDVLIQALTPTKATARAEKDNDDLTPKKAPTAKKKSDDSTSSTTEV